MGKTHQEVVETRVHVSELALGMHVVRLDRAWEETDFLLQGFVIRNSQEIHSLQAQCNFVFIEGRLDTASQHTRPARSETRPKSSSGFFGMFKGSSKKAKEQEQVATQPKTRKRVTYINKVDLGTELPFAAVKFEDAQQTAKSIMSG